MASRINSLARQKAHELSISKRPIRVGFLAINPAQFVYQNLYDTMSKDNDFDPYVIVCPDWVNAEHGTNESLKRLFTDKGMQVATSIDPDNPPDMVFFPNFDDHVFSGVISLRKSYDKILCCSLLYSMGIDNSGAFYVYHPDFRYMWRQYVPCEFYRELATRRGLRKGDNVVCCGSPKSDSIFNTTGKCSYWKDSSHRRKRFIWAPHWSVLTHGRTSNFDRYYKTQDDPYLETREREEQFIERIVAAVEASLDRTLPAYWSEHIPQTTPTTENKHQTEPEVAPEPDVDWDFLGG